MKNPLVLSLVLATLLVGCKKTEEAATPTMPETTHTETTTTPTETTPKDTAPKDTAPEVTKLGDVPAGYTAVEALSKEPKREFDKEPAMTLQDGTDYYALIDTNKGQILLDLYEQETPVTVNNFVTLARYHFYDNTRFHRVIDGFMAQAGDPNSADETKKDTWGTGGPGYQFADEFRNKLRFSSEGVLAMANSGPQTNGSQFFITFAPTDFLNGRHTIFGKVVSGDDVLAKLTRTSSSEGGPEQPIEGAVADKVLAVRILTKSK